MTYWYILCSILLCNQRNRSMDCDRHWFVRDRTHCLERELHGENRCELPEEKDVLFWPLYLMEFSRNEKFVNLKLYSGV